MKVRCRTGESVRAEVEGVHRHIAQRAQEIFRARGGALGHAVEDWITAERETIWRPALEVRRTRDAFVVEAAIAGIDQKQLDVQVTPTELVRGAPVHHSDREQEGEVVLCEFANGPLFRSYRFPDPVDLRAGLSAIPKRDASRDGAAGTTRHEGRGRSRIAAAERG
jgi:HSP20 family molecular chaperone IbpA